MKSVFALVVILVFGSSVLFGQGKVGDPAPDFNLNGFISSETGYDPIQVSLSDQKGKVVFLHFFGHG